MCIDLEPSQDLSGTQATRPGRRSAWPRGAREVSTKIAADMFDLPQTQPEPEPESGKRRRSRSAAGASPRTQLTPSDWIDAATELLVRRSVDAVNVDTLAKNLGVTRGSFYWHFSDREDLLVRMLERWRDRATQQVITRFERKGAQAQELINELLDLPFRGKAASEAASIELAIRAWARRDETARAAVDAVDAQRLAYIAQCFSALEFDISQARSRAFLLYAYELAESFLIGQGSDSQRADRRQLIGKLSGLALEGD